MATRIKKLSIIALITLCCATCSTQAFAASQKKTAKPAAQKVTVIQPKDDHEELFKKAYIEKNDVLSIKDCVSIAFHNSPVIKKYKYNLDLAKSNVGIAKSEYFPVISAGAGFYNTNHSNGSEYHDHVSEFPSVAVTINKLVYNFGKTTANIKMEEFYKIGAEYEFIDSLCETLFDVKEKYYALLLAQSRLQVERKNFELNEQFLDMANNLSQKNKTKEADITSARFNYNVARVRYLQAKNSYDNARIDLNNAMFVETPYEYKIENTDTYSYANDFIDNEVTKEFIPENLPFDKKDAVLIAYKNSPDLKVLIATYKAMEQNLNYIKRTYFPDLSVNGGYGYYNNNHAKGDNSLQVGVSLSSSVNLMNLRHSLKGADAQLNIADNEIVLFKKNLNYEVQRSLTNLQKAEMEFPIAQIAVANAYSHLKIVIEEYKNGQADYVALQAARTSYQNAMNNYIDALYIYNIALINVERAMHCHIIDIHHKSEHAIHYHSDELIEHINKWMNCDEKERRKRVKKEYQL
ncbi:TolC family protein [bacterium]|nr:TolC family protein [bacterium]